MSTPIFRSTVPSTFKKTLEAIVDDDLGGAKASAVYPKWCAQKDVDEAYVDFLEMGGPGLISEKAEGTSIQTAGIKEGTLWRHIPRTWAVKLIITEETIEDCKYPQVLNLSKRLTRSVVKTTDVDTTNMLARGFNSSFLGADGVSLFSNAHTLPQGGTFSNLMATPIAISTAALIIARAQVGKMLGHDGTIEGFELEKLLFPTELWGIAEETVGSAMRPEAGNFATVNVAKGLGLELVPIKYWTNSTTNWALTTSAEGGPTVYWRRRMRQRTWDEEDNMTMNQAISARWTRGWTDARSIYGVQA